MKYQFILWKNRTKLLLAMLPEPQDFFYHFNSCFKYFDFWYMYFNCWLGMAAIVWFVLWCWLITESPLDHSTITNEELEHITGTIGFSYMQFKVSNTSIFICKVLEFSELPMENNCIYITSKLHCVYFVMLSGHLTIMIYYKINRQSDPYRASRHPGRIFYFLCRFGR